MAPTKHWSAARAKSRQRRAREVGGCVAVKSGGHSTATQRAPDRGGRCPAGPNTNCTHCYRINKKSVLGVLSCCAQRLARQ